MPNINDLQSEAGMYKLASGDTSGLNSMYDSGTPDMGMMPDDYMPTMPMPQHGGAPRDYFISPAQAHQMGPQVAPDNNVEQMLTSILKAKESSDNYQAVNPKSSASGAYQYTDSTWNGYGGYAKAALAPAAVQDAKFAHDIAARLAAYGNDPYKAIVAHYLPALANQPDKWAHPFKVGGRVVKPALSYLKYVVKDTPLEAGLASYLMHGQPNPAASTN